MTSAGFVFREASLTSTATSSTPCVAASRKLRCGWVRWAGRSGWTRIWSTSCRATYGPLGRSWIRCGCATTWRYRVRRPRACPPHGTLYQAAGVDQRTADAYEGLLESLYLLDRVPAWSSNWLARLVKRAKRYIVDPALAMSAARVDRADFLRDGELLGRVLDTFVAAQLRPEVALRPRTRLHHLRTESGRQEIDLIVDLGGGRVLAVEVKAGAAPSARDARHLGWLRDELGEQFVRGIVLHTGPKPFELGDRLWALPICALWAAG